LCNSCVKPSSSGTSQRIIFFIKIMIYKSQSAILLCTKKIKSTMRKTAIAVVAFIAIVIGAVTFLPIKPGEMPPIIQDQIEIEDQSQSNIGISVKDTPNLADSTVSSNQIGYDIHIDDEGIKNYIINAVDMPDIEG